MTIARYIFAAAVALLAAAVPALGQAPSPVYESWYPTGRASLSVSNVSARVALPSVGPSALLCNTGGADAFMQLGGSSVAAVAATSYALRAGTCAVYNLRPASGTAPTYVAGITASSTTTIYIETGIGAPAMLPIGGGGQSVTQGTSPWVVNTTQFGGAAVATGDGAVSSGTLRVAPASWTYANIATATTTTVKSGAGVLHSVCVNTLGTVASTATIYDNTAGSGTKIGTINTLALGGCFAYDVAFATGLTIVTTGTAAPDLTVSYR